jgi:hypothetical protein
MLVIRNEQMKVFERERVEAFKCRLAAHLRGVLDRIGRKMPEDKFAAQLALGFERGQRFFRNESDLARYSEIVLLRLGGWSEEDHPERALQMLRARDVSAQTRLNNFERWAERHVS